MVSWWWYVHYITRNDWLFTDLKASWHFEHQWGVARQKFSWPLVYDPVQFSLVFKREFYSLPLFLTKFNSPAVALVCLRKTLLARASLPFQFDHSYAEELLEHHSIITFTCAKVRNGPLWIIHNIQEEMPEYPTRSFKIIMCQRERKLWSAQIVWEKNK